MSDTSNDCFIGGGGVFAANVDLLLPPALRRVGAVTEIVAAALRKRDVVRNMNHNGAIATSDNRDIRQTKKNKESSP